MKRLLAALAGILGIAWLRTRSKAAQPAPQPDAQPDPAEELRARLAETRVDEPEPEPDVPAADVAARRQDVHERARAATQDLAGPDE